MVTTILGVKLHGICYAIAVQPGRNSWSEEGADFLLAPLLSVEWLSLLFWLKKDGPRDDSRFVVGVGAGRGGSEAQVVMQVRGERSSPSGMLFVQPSEELCFATTVAGGNSLMVEHSLAKAEVEGSSPSFRSWLRHLVVTSRVGIASRSNPSFPGLPNTLLIRKKPPANRNRNRIRKEKKEI
ncbi:hypothetical protein Lal_00019203 [Lupinus albus]|nr:hypothetical protein Lal_00019203 [Lupinus albus]